MKRLLVSGANGFIGKNLVQKLFKYKSFVVTGFGTNKNYFQNQDILEKVVAENDIIIHLAGSSNPEEEDVIKTNLDLTKKLLEACKKNNNKQVIIFASSFAVYEIPQKGDVVSENYKTNPRNNYGISKLKCERLIKKYCDDGYIRSVILRFSNIYGYGVKTKGHSVVANFIESMKKNNQITIFGDGKQTRDFIYIDDAINAIIKSINYKENYSIFNICSGEETSINKLVKILGHVSGKNILVEKKNTDRNSLGYWKGSLSYAKKELAWEPRVDIKSGIIRTWKHET